MSNTVPAVPAAQPAVPADSTTPAQTNPNDVTAPAPKNKFENVSKTVGAKAKGFLGFFHTAGEQIRGNINAALDGAGDAVAGRKTGSVQSRSVDTKAATPAAVTAETAAPVAQTETAAAPVANVDAAQPNANVSRSETVATEKKYPVGQRINHSFKRTLTLVHRVTGNLRSNANRTVDAFGNTIAQGKQQASKRFSKSQKPTASAEQDPVAVVPEQAPILDNTPPAETVPVNTPATTAA